MSLAAWHALEEEEEQILLRRSSRKEDIGDCYVFRVMKYKSFHDTNLSAQYEP